MDMDMEIYSSFKDTIQFTLDPFIFFLICAVYFFFSEVVQQHNADRVNV